MLHWDLTSVCEYQKGITLASENAVIVFLSSTISMVLLMGYRHDAAVTLRRAEAGACGG